MNNAKKLCVSKLFAGMKIVQTGGLVCGSAVLLAALSASSAIESQIIDYGSAAAPDTTGTIELSYKDFNPSLGTLTGVEIILNSYDTAEAEVLIELRAGKQVCQGRHL